MCGRDASLFVVGTAMPIDDGPDMAAEPPMRAAAYDRMIARGAKAHVLTVPWDRLVSHATFHHNEPAVEPPFENPRPDIRALWRIDDDDEEWDDGRWRRAEYQAWSHLPRVRVHIDPEAAARYAWVVDQLTSRGIEPIAVLDPWRMPDAVRNAIGGWSSPLAIEAYAEYARACFSLFGHAVRRWVCFVGPFRVAGDVPGARLAVHHVVLAHARAAAIHRSEYARDGQEGAVGIAIDCLPDGEGDPCFEWFAEPFRSGTYARHACCMDLNALDGEGCQEEGTLATALADRMTFTPAQRALVRRSAGFVVLECAPDGERDPATDLTASVDRAAWAFPGAPVYIIDDPMFLGRAEAAPRCLGARVHAAAACAQKGRPVRGYLVRHADQEEEEDDRLAAS